MESYTWNGNMNSIIMKVVMARAPGDFMFTWAQQWINTDKLFQVKSLVHLNLIELCENTFDAYHFPHPPPPQRKNK